MLLTSNADPTVISSLRSQNWLGDIILFFVHLDTGHARVLNLVEAEAAIISPQLLLAFFLFAMF